MNSNFKQNDLEFCEEFFDYHNIKLMKKVAYVYNDSIANFQFAKEHPMKPKRIRMAHSLIQNYGMGPYLNMFQSRQASAEEMAYFHDPGYISYLEKWVIPKKEDPSIQPIRDDERRRIRDDPKLKAKYKVNQSYDCPGFQGLYNFCQLAAGSSLDSADLIITGMSDVVVNWSGGYHHARKTQASGFCYVNDIVMCILELLKIYPRVLYLDLDVHHGDGVEQAFYNTNRVMTVSFHEFEEDFFPGTGSLDSTGEGIGKYFAVNIPLKKGITDMPYLNLFKSVMDRCMASYRPDVIVVQCGTDSLAKDKLGHFNLSIKGHAEAAEYMLRYGTPAIFLGGGGYTIENVARCWTYETSKIIGFDIEDKIPENDQFYNLYHNDSYKLHFPIDNRINDNTQEHLNHILETITENLRESEIRPSLAFHNAPKNFLIEEDLEWRLLPEDDDSFDDSQCRDIFSKN